MKQRGNAGFIAVLSAVLFFGLAGAASAASLTIQAVTNKTNYAPLSVVTIRATAQNGLKRITSSAISTATVTIKDATGTTVLSGASMSKDSATGLCFYNYTLVNTAVKGVWTATVSIKDRSGNTGTGSVTFRVQTAVPDHTALISVYEGTKTCIACHARRRMTCSALFIINGQATIRRP